MNNASTITTKPSSRGPAGKRRRQAAIPERLLADLWRKRAARQAWFRTGGGARMRVVYPGCAGHSAGPDFRNALLEVEGLGLVQGDVEIHLHQRDWDSHGHGKDPNYNGVVLHAALEVDAPVTSLQSGRQAPVVCLSTLLEDGSPNARPAPSLWTVLGGEGYRRPGTPRALGKLLDRAGDRRFMLKSAGFQTFLNEQGPDQTLYEGILEGLGYRNNQQPFLKLATRASYAALQRAARRAPEEGRAQALESWLVRLSGLSPTAGVPEKPLPRTGFGAPLSAGEWHCFRVRPTNHPRRRIGGAARLLDRFIEEGLAAGLGRVASAGSPRELTLALEAGGEKAWIGRARARDLAVNVVLPFLHALGSRPGGGPSSGDCLALYRRFGKLQENELTREMAGQLVDPAWGGVLTTARRQQGLLHLHSLMGAAC
ncbi:MAG: DUF2851 family protein [Dehalococcoidia bacterium]|nr:DUF2851 family protein [Dehalococcoidia bacterium]